MAEGKEFVVWQLLQTTYLDCRQILLDHKQQIDQCVGTADYNLKRSRQADPIAGVARRIVGPNGPGADPLRQRTID